MALVVVVGFNKMKLSCHDMVYVSVTMWPLVFCYSYKSISFVNCYNFKSTLDENYVLEILDFFRHIP